MLGIAGEVKAPTYAELYSGDWVPLHVVGVCVNRIGKVSTIVPAQVEPADLA